MDLLFKLSLSGHSKFKAIDYKTKEFFPQKWPQVNEKGFQVARAGLPDFSGSKHAKMGKNAPNDHKLYPMCPKQF
jgi:hypothetical protein